MDSLFKAVLLQAAQPALLYIVPAVLVAVSIHSLLNGEFKQLWSWSEEVVEEGEETVQSVKAEVKEEVAEETRKDR